MIASLKLHCQDFDGKLCVNWVLVIMNVYENVVKRYVVMIGRYKSGK